MTWESILTIDDGEIVREPRATDAIGMMMRDAYGNLVSLPDDMRRLLHRLDRSSAKTV